MRTTIIGLLCATLSLGTANQVFAQEATQEATAWHTVAAAIPLGTKVKIQTKSGDRMSGTLMNVTADSVMVKKDTRRPVPAVTVPFTDVARIERDRGTNVNVGKAIAVGLAAGAGVILGLFAIALQLD